MISLHTINLWQQLTVIIDSAIGALLGSIIGWERDRAGKSAGARTMALVGTSSAFIVSLGVVVNYGSHLGDPTRTIQAIMTGIGFLGAGLIFQSKRSGVQGVTTAATVFVTAAMGCGIGLGFQAAGIALTFIVLTILRSTQFLEATAQKTVLRTIRRTSSAGSEVIIEETVESKEVNNKDKTDKEK